MVVIQKMLLLVEVILSSVDSKMMPSVQSFNYNKGLWASIANLFMLNLTS